MTKPSPSPSLSACIDPLPAPLLSLSLSVHSFSVFCGYVAAPTTHQLGKRKKPDLPSVPPPAKTSFRSTECLLLSLLRQGACDEAESPMREVLGGTLQSRLAALKGGVASRGDGQLGGSCTSLSTVGFARPRTKCCSLETILDDSAPLTRQPPFLSHDSLADGSSSPGDGSAIATACSHTDSTSVSKATAFTSVGAPAGTTGSRLSVAGPSAAAHGLRSSRPRSTGSCLDIVVESREEDAKEPKFQGRATSCLNVNTAAARHHSSASRPPSLYSHLPTFSSSGLSSAFSSSSLAKAQRSHATPGPSGHRPACTTSNLWPLPLPAVVRRCVSSLDVSKPPRPVTLCKPPVCVPTTRHPQPQTEHSKTVSPRPVRLSIVV